MLKTSFQTLRALVVFGSLCVASLGASGDTVSVTDIGTLGSSNALARFINNLGYVAGEIDASNGAEDAFLYDGISMRGLGFGYYVPLNIPAGHPLAINNAGQVIGIGSVLNPNGHYDTHVFIFDGITTLDITPGGRGEPTAINDNGQVIGGAQFPGGPAYWGFIYNPATGLQGLPTLGGTVTQPYAINKYGAVAGISNTIDSAHAFIYDSGGMHDIHQIGIISEAFAINNNGQAVGDVVIDSAFDEVGFFFDGVTMRSLSFGGDTCEAYFVNDKGYVAGIADLPGEGINRVFFYDGTTLKIITPPDATYADVRAMNEAGQVAGNFNTASGENHGFLYDASGFHDIGPHPVVPVTGHSGSRASQVLNASGQVATVDGVYDRNGLHLLSVPGVGGYEVAGINDAGLVAGWYRASDGLDHAFVASVPPPSGNTPPGTNISVTPEGGTLITFSNVTVGGDTTLSSSGTPPSPPAGYKLGTPPAYYDIVTTAQYTGNVTVCFTYSPSQFVNVKSLRLFHYVNNAWVDVTTSNDQASSMICGVVTSLSPFVLVEAPSYTVLPLFDQTKTHKSGSVCPIKLQLTDTGGANLSSSSLVVHATSTTQLSGIPTGLLDDAGASNPDYDFRYDSTLGAGGGYIFNLSLKGYAPGIYLIHFKAGLDPTDQTLQFQVK